LEHCSNLSFSQVADLLNVPKNDVEQWAIEAISAGIIDAKVDQMKEELVIKSHLLPDLNK
jgi:hypothetical protein